MTDATSRIVALTRLRRNARQRLDPLLRTHADLARLEQRVRRRTSHDAEALLQAAGLQSPQSALHGSARQAVDEQRDDDDEKDRQGLADHEIRCFCGGSVSGQVERLSTEPTRIVTTGGAQALGRDRCDPERKHPRDRNARVGREASYRSRATHPRGRRATLGYSSSSGSGAIGGGRWPA
jgi:hypothetical protein